MFDFYVDSAVATGMPAMAYIYAFMFTRLKA